MPQDTITNLDIAKAGITRKDLAAAVGMSYSVLSQKMGGFLVWQPGEIEACEAYLKKMARRQA